MTTEDRTFFAPQLYIKSGVRNIDFYFNGLGAVEHKRWANDDGSLHVAELSIDISLFHHLHVERPDKGKFEPEKNNGVTTLTGLFVADVDKVMSKAIQAGATLINPARGLRLWLPAGRN